MTKSPPKFGGLFLVASKHDQTASPDQIIFSSRNIAMCSAP